MLGWARPPPEIQGPALRFERETLKLRARQRSPCGRPCERMIRDML